MNAAPAMIEVIGLACGHGQRRLVSDVSFLLHAHQILCLLGPNGVGKTTLFRTLLRLLPPQSGRIVIMGEDTASWGAARFARVVGYVPQAHASPFPFRVCDVVAMGRTAHLGVFQSPSRNDITIAMASLETLSIGHLGECSFNALSGGERQMVLIARALAQRPRLLVLDEPTSNLDFGNQVAVLEQVRDLAARQDMAVIMTTHDPNHALGYGSAVATLDRQGRFTLGRPAEIITESYLSTTYGIRTKLFHLAGHPPLCLPLGRQETAPCA
ncbi:MAG: ABC transporter ATP-binding protein [Magnetospirillum sp.]